MSTMFWLIVGAFSVAGLVSWILLKQTRRAFCAALELRRGGGFPVEDDKVRIVYRPKSTEEARRPCDRAEALVGTPFLQLPGKPAQHKVLFVSSEGHKVKVSDVEMVFNDALVMDAISNWGEDGPLYQETLDTEIMREIYRYAQTAFAGVDLPQQIKRPPVN